MTGPSNCTYKIQQRNPADMDNANSRRFKISVDYRVSFDLMKITHSPKRCSTF